MDKLDTNNEKLTVFDVQRFALHDGPGIRTTVFLKGCPLDCVWCHNPESKSRKPQLGFLIKNCTNCGTCQSICKRNVHQVDIAKDVKEATEIKGERHQINFTSCVQCGECVKACSNKALKIFGNSMSAEEILQTVIKDKDFYQRSGGGLTVSGGEAMVQFKPLLELLKKAKEADIHVCLDTCGQASTEKYKEIAKYVDIFLFDYKLTDSQEHKQYTGVDNSLILKNLRYLCEIGANVYLRCPIIPGINDKKSHYQAIADLSKQYESIRQVNLMTYHDMAKGKAAQIGEVYTLPNIKTILADEKKKIYEQVKDCGCLRLTEG